MKFDMLGKGRNGNWDGNLLVLEYLLVTCVSSSRLNLVRRHRSSRLLLRLHEAHVALVKERAEDHRLLFICYLSFGVYSMSLLVYWSFGYFIMCFMYYDVVLRFLYHYLIWFMYYYGLCIVWLRYVVYRVLAVCDEDPRLGRAGYKVVSQDRFARPKSLAVNIIVKMYLKHTNLKRKKTVQTNTKKYKRKRQY